MLVIGTDDSWHEQPGAIAAALRSEVGHARADWDLRTQPLGPDGQLLVGRIAFVVPDGIVLQTRAAYVLRRDGAGWRIAHSPLSLPQNSGGGANGPGDCRRRCRSQPRAGVSV